MAFESIKELIEYSQNNNKEIWHITMEEDASERGISEKETYETMKKMWLSMKKSAEEYDPKIKSKSGLSGGDAEKINLYANKSTCGKFMSDVISNAIAIAESNACMKCIVATPTAGSCGVLPAVLIPCAKKYNLSEETIIKSLFHCAAFGQIIAKRAFISGAEGGCQAEIGSASAMASAMLTYIKGGTNIQSSNSVAIALKSLLGLVCDPVAGLVEVPCVKRNVIGALNAISASDMAMAGIESAIPADEVIDAMKEIGEALPEGLKETSKGGLAATPTGLRIDKTLPKLEKLLNMRA